MPQEIVDNLGILGTVPQVGGLTLACVICNQSFYDTNPHEDDTLYFVNNGTEGAEEYTDLYLKSNKLTDIVVVTSDTEVANVPMNKLFIWMNDDVTNGKINKGLYYRTLVNSTPTNIPLVSTTFKGAYFDSSDQCIHFQLYDSSTEYKVPITYEGFNVPLATTDNAGVVIVGTGLSVDSSGVLSADIPKATYSSLGLVSVGTGLSIDGNGELSAVAASYTGGDGIDITDTTISVDCDSSLTFVSNQLSVSIIDDGALTDPS